MNTDLLPRNERWMSIQRLSEILDTDSRGQDLITKLLTSPSWKGLCEIYPQTGGEKLYHKNINWKQSYHLLFPHWLLRQCFDNADIFIKANAIKRLRRWIHSGWLVGWVQWFWKKSPLRVKERVLTCNKTKLKLQVNEMKTTSLRSLLLEINHEFSKKGYVVCKLSYYIP